MVSRRSKVTSRAASGFLEDAGESDAKRTLAAMRRDAGRGRNASLRPENLVVAVGVERRVNVDEVNALVGELGELFEIVAAVDDAGVDEGGGLSGTRS